MIKEVIKKKEDNGKVWVHLNKPWLQTKKNVEFVEVKKYQDRIEIYYNNDLGGSDRIKKQILKNIFENILKIQRHKKVKKDVQVNSKRNG